MKSRLMTILTTSVLVVTSVGCAKSSAPDRTVGVELHGGESSQANRYDAWRDQSDGYLLRGLVRERSILQIKDDPYNPDYDSFDLEGLSQEERAALKRANDEAPVARWRVDVLDRQRNPEGASAEDTIHVTRPLTDVEWADYNRDGAFPARFAEIDGGEVFEFSLVDDRFRRRGRNAEQHAFFVLTGWRRPSSSVTSPRLEPQRD